MDHIRARAGISRSGRQFDLTVVEAIIATGTPLPATVEEMNSGQQHTLLALLGLRLKGFASAAAVADVVGVDEADIAVALQAAVSEGLVRFNEDRGVYLLDPATGRPEGERLLSDQLDDADVRADVEAAYREFLVLNGPMLQLCTDWQIRSGDSDQALNDHSDEAYDQSVIARLVSLDTDLGGILARLGDALDRYGSYAGRFQGAIDRLRGGELDFFTKPMIPSYHTVWFELHEDLLATLGIDRVSEAGLENGP